MKRIIMGAVFSILAVTTAQADYSVEVHVNKPAPQKVVVIKPAPVVPKVVVVKHPQRTVIVKPRRYRGKRVVVKW